MLSYSSSLDILYIASYTHTFDNCCFELHRDYLWTHCNHKNTHFSEWHFQLPLSQFELTDPVFQCQLGSGIVILCSVEILGCCVQNVGIGANFLDRIIVGRLLFIQQAIQADIDTHVIVKNTCTAAAGIMTLSNWGKSEVNDPMRGGIGQNCIGSWVRWPRTCMDPSVSTGIHVNAHDIEWSQVI